MSSKDLVNAALKRGSTVRRSDYSVSETVSLRNGQLLSGPDFVEVGEAVGLGNVHVLVGVAIEILADFRKVVAGLHDIYLLSGNDLDVVLEVGEAGIDRLDAVPDAVLAGFGDDGRGQDQLFPAVPRASHVQVALSLGKQLEQPPHALLHLPLQVAPKTLFQLADEMLELLGDGCYLRHGCKSPCENGFSFSGQTYTLSSFTQSKLRQTQSRLILNLLWLYRSKPLK